GNLLSNAAKFSPDEEPIDVAVERDDVFVRMAVRDHGRGISAETSDRLFERFYRGEDQEARGTGIGLTVVKELAELQGGRVQARNAEAGPGAVFTVWLPAASMDGGEGREGSGVAATGRRVEVPDPEGAV
ncbi:MAG: sensor histidine kinase, partial [Actinobacteria bacterium]|nr:sensor histidine kinase [Actinomycetota bacterium]